MVANRTSPLLRRALVTSVALALGFSLSAVAQTATTSDNSADTYSTSNIEALLSPSAFLGGGGSPSASPAPRALASPQYGNQRAPQYPGYESRFSHVAFVGGGGFSAPIGNDTHGFETWGYNLDVGGGWNFNKKVGVLFEYQFDRMKIPGSTLANAGVQGGNINSHLFLIDPVYYFYSSRKSGAYITGGGGFSRKVTNFTDLEQGEECYYFCYYVTEPVTVATFSSTQGAADAGIGFIWKAFGPDSNGKLFIEARYVFVDSPKPTTTSEGEGTEGLVPVTIGIRF